MLNFIDTVGEAVARIKDGSTVMIGGVGNAGQPFELIDALMDCGARELTVVNNNAGQGDQGLALLIKEGRVKKMICSFPRQSDSWHFDAKYKAGEIELELVPQGNLVYRKTARNFGPIMAAAAKQTIVQVSGIVPVGGLDPENIVTPGIYVNSIVKVA
jgi:3-oxoadipate CoA-transferase alpha subunit